MRYNLALLGLASLHFAQGWAPSCRDITTTSATLRPKLLATTALYAASKDEDEGDEKDELEEKLGKIEQIGDDLLVNAMGSAGAASAAGETPKLGIDIGSQLAPLTDKEAAELKAAAMEVINDGVAEGIDEIAKLRKNMKQDIQKQKAAMSLKSDLELQREQEKLLKKIDQMTGSFLEKTEAVREETKLVARADKSSEGQAMEVGVWGVIGGAAVVTTGSKNVGLLGSVDAAKAEAEKEAKKLKDQEMSDLKRSASVAVEEVLATNANRIVIVADTSQDPMAKQLVPAFSARLQSAIPNLEDIAVYRPTDTIPLGGDNAICAVLFLTSLSDRSAVNKVLERLLRRTMAPGGALGAPPTQLVGVSSIGTERTDKFPYSMQNLMGGKLDQRRQVEEALIATVQNRVASPPLDYTICKFGELKDNSKEEFAMMPGDVLDGTTPLETATNVLMQAVAYQPYARNATLCSVGKLPDTNSDDEIMEEIWEDAFLRLDGPELERWTSFGLGGPEVYDRLCEYLNEWANNFALNPRGLTTPIRVELSRIKRNRLQMDTTVRERTGMELLFLPTATGKNYLSKEEERQLEDEGRGTARAMVSRSKMAKEGGIEVVVEITEDDQLRIRAKRCNYADGVPIKELSEETILKRLEKAIDVWCQETK